MLVLCKFTFKVPLFEKTRIKVSDQQIIFNFFTHYNFYVVRDIFIYEFKDPGLLLKD